MVASDSGAAFAADTPLAEACVRHARMFFNRPDFDLATAKPGTFALAPHDDMLAALERDYAAMAGMIFGEVPQFEKIMESITDLENRINARKQA